MKITVIGPTSAGNLGLCEVLQRKGVDHHIIPWKHEEKFFKKPLLTALDLWHIQTSDVVTLFGTWNSNNHNRKWHPVTNTRRQAFVNETNGFFVGIAKMYNVPVLCFETATLSRIRQTISGRTHWKDENPKYYRMGLNHWTYDKATFLKPTRDRLEKFIETNAQYPDMHQQLLGHGWRNNRQGKICIFVGLENDPTSTMPGSQFVKTSVEKIRQYTDREIVIKPHPLSQFHPDGYNVLSNKMTIKKLSQMLYCAVLDNSTSIFELTYMGIPCFTTKANFGYKLGNNDLTKINDIYYETPEKMREWYNEMANTEFLVYEFREDTILDYIEEMLNDNT